MPRIAIVTGASSGLGREFVKQIDAGKAGHIDEIWVVARRAERLEALRRTCKKPVRPFCLDVTDPVSFDIIAAALNEVPKTSIELLVNNAGAGTFGTVAAQNARQSQNMMKLLMLAPVEMMHVALPYLREGSRIINVSSVAAFAPQPGLSVYSAAKRFILDVSRSLDTELEGTDIHVTALCPKFMQTEFLHAAGNSQAARKMTRIGFEQVSRVVSCALRSSKLGYSLCIPAIDMKAYYLASRVLPYRLLIEAERRLGIL